VDKSKIDASYHSGVLELRLPKIGQAQGKRIPVITN
jgi:HSP20 family molecular chaperone IbpA